MSAATRYLPIVAGAVAGGAIALAVAGGSTDRSVTTTVLSAPAGTALPTSLGVGKGISVRQISRAAGPGVVDIKVRIIQHSADPFGLGGGTQTSVGEGSGVVYDSQGHVLTDEHVIAGASSATVTFSDGKSYPADIVGSDKSTDVGVIKVKAPASELHVLTLADSAAAEVGDGVVAIGSPFGLPGTVTAGIVSATGRSIQAPNKYTITGSIQTDAAINQGNSGGPLLDSQAHVLGLNDQIETNSGSNAGVGFAVPSNTVRRVADLLIAGHAVTHSYMGVELLPTGLGQGATLAKVAPGGPAAAAGLQPGDTIVAFGGRAITSTDQFITKVDTYAPGQTVTVTVKRNGSTMPVKVTLGTRPGA